MNHMEKVFTEMKKKGEKVNVLYFPIGDTILGDSVEWAKKYFDNGCTVLEIGLPYENPALDGPTVADSMARALTQVDLEKVFAMIGQIRKECPENILQIMTYYENIAKYGVKEFARKCRDCGADAVLTPNSSPEQREELDRELGKYDMINLRFKPFHMSEEDIMDCAKNARGYIFSQAVDGGTGTRATVSPHVAENVKILHDSGTKALVVPGFGISNPQQAEEVLKMGADGFVIGSAVIKHIIAGDGESFIHSVSQVCRLVL